MPRRRTKSRNDGAGGTAEPVILLPDAVLVNDGSPDPLPGAAVRIDGNRIAEVGDAKGVLDAHPDATILELKNCLVMPGLVNAHTHGHSTLGKGRGDKWSFELALNASPGISGGFSLEDKHTAALLNAAEMVLKGCTAAFDMCMELPTPTIEGMTAVGSAYSELGVRLVLAPMMADMTLYRAIPGLMDVLPAPHRSHVERMRAAPHEEHLAVCGKLLHDWPFDRDQVAVFQRVSEVGVAGVLAAVPDHLGEIGQRPSWLLVEGLCAQHAALDVPMLPSPDQGRMGAFYHHGIAGRGVGG